jgi:mxaA protein
MSRFIRQRSVMACRVMIVLIACLTLSLSLSLTVSAAPAQVEQPRAFGHVLGDVLTQRILLQSGSNTGNTAMPSTGRIGIWFERRSPRIETDADGRRWLIIDYQITNAPQTLTTVALPALTLTSSSGRVLQVPEWPVSVGPLTPQSAFATGDLQALRPDRQARQAATAPLRRQMAWALGLLALTLLAWLGWWQWRNRREAARLPFARAWAGMQRSKAAGDNHDAQAWLSLHRALNETAGQVVHAGSLPDLFVKAPHFQVLRPQLERFYQQSGERFFSSGSADAGFPLLDLCRDLYRAERRRQT